MVECPVIFRSQARIAAVNKFLAAELLEDLLFQRFQGFLFILAAGEKGEGQGKPVPVRKEPHLDDGIGAVLLAFAILFIPVFLFNLKIIIRTVIVEEPVIPFPEEKAVLIDFGLDKIEFFRKDGKGPVNVMQLIGRGFQETLGGLEGRAFAGRFQDSGIDQVREDGIEVKFFRLESMMG